MRKGVLVGTTINSQKIFHFHREIYQKVHIARNWLGVCTDTPVNWIKNLIQQKLLSPRSLSSEVEMILEFFETPCLSTNWR